MTWEAALRTRLKNDGTVSGLVGASGSAKSIDWNIRPQSLPYPSVVMGIVFDDRDQHMAGFNTFRRTRTQFRCTALTRATAISLRDAVIAVIVPAATQSGTEFLRAQKLSVVPETENTATGTLHHEIIDAVIWHN